MLLTQINGVSSADEWQTFFGVRKLYKWDLKDPEANGKGDNSDIRTRTTRLEG